MKFPPDNYADYADHPRYGRGPKISGLNPDPLDEGVHLHWNATTIAEVQARIKKAAAVRRTVSRAQQNRRAESGNGRMLRRACGIPGFQWRAGTACSHAAEQSGGRRGSDAAIPAGRPTRACSLSGVVEIIARCYE